MCFSVFATWLEYDQHIVHMYCMCVLVVVHVLGVLHYCIVFIRLCHTFSFIVVRLSSVLCIHWVRA